MVCTAQTKPGLATNLGPGGAQPRVTGWNSGGDFLKQGHRLKWGCRGSPERPAPLHGAPVPSAGSVPGSWSVGESQGHLHPLRGQPLPGVSLT